MGVAVLQQNFIYKNEGQDRVVDGHLSLRTTDNEEKTNVIVNSVGVGNCFFCPDSCLVVSLEALLLLSCFSAYPSRGQ